MKTEHQNRAISNLIGHSGELEVFPGGYEKISFNENFTSDLNLMRKAEEWLKGKLLDDMVGFPSLDAWTWYQNNLFYVCMKEPIWHASASQKAEAFLRTFKLWVE